MAFARPGCRCVGEVDMIDVLDFLATRVAAVWSEPQIPAPANLLSWLAEEGNTCLKELHDVREDSKLLIRTIACCLHTNARLEPLRQCLLTRPYLRTSSGHLLSSEVWQRIVQFASGLSDRASSPRMLNVVAPRVLMCADFVDTAIACPCPGCEAMSRRRATTRCQLRLRGEKALDSELFGYFKQAKAIYVGRCADIFALAKN